MYFTLKKIPIFVHLFFLLILGWHTSFAQEYTNKFTVKGQVTDAKNRPLAGVNVIFPQLNKGSSTDAEGYYTIEKIPSGTYTISFSFIGYATKTQRISVRSGSPNTLNIRLHPQSLQVDAITVTGAAYASDPLTTPADVDVLSGDEKFADEQTSLGASLDKLAGVSTISTGSQIGKPVIRGLSGNRIRVLDDGVAMDYNQFGVRHGPNVDPFLSKRIEVVRGAASVQYGSDAMGGAINVISNSVPNATNGKPFVDGQILGEYATNNKEVSGGLHLDGATGGLGFTGTIIRRSSGDIHTADAPNFKESGVSTDPKFTGKLPHTDFDQLNGSLGVGYQGGFGKISAEYTRWKNEHNFLLPNGKGLGQNLENNTYKLKGNFPLGNSFILKPNFTFNRNIRQSNAGGKNASPRNTLPSSGPAFLDLLIDSYTSKINIEHPAIGPFAGTIGLGYLHEDQHTNGTGEALVPSGKINNFGAFFFEKAELGDFTLSVGARVDGRSQQAKPNEDLHLPDYNAGEPDNVLDQEYTDLSGSVGGTYRFTEQFAVAANVGRGFRAPSFFDLHVDGQHGGVAAYQVGDPDLNPEHSLNTDLSLRWRSASVTAKVTGYRNAIQNYIFLVNTGSFTGSDGNGPPILRTTQGDARLLGVDASMNTQLTTWLQVDATFEQVQGKNIDDSIKNVDELPLLPATKLSGGIKLMSSGTKTLENPYLRMDIEHSFKKDAAGRYEPFWQFGPAFPFGRASTDAYTLLNVTIGFNLQVWDRPIVVNIQAHNLLDKAYRDFLDTYKGYALSPGRSLTMRIKVPFTIL